MKLPVAIPKNFRYNIPNTKIGGSVMKLFVVVDMQKDFVDGALGTPEAEAIVAPAAEKLKQALAAGDTVVFTLDTHGADYLDTQEGKYLPVPHCIKGSAGWQLVPPLEALAQNCRRFEKPAFGSMELARFAAQEGFDAVELIGLCTDICVISNAMLLKAALPEAVISVDAACCAGVTPDSHRNALHAMKQCQIQVTE